MFYSIVIRLILVFILNPFYSQVIGYKGYSQVIGYKNLAESESGLKNYMSDRLELGPILRNKLESHKRNNNAIEEIKRLTELGETELGEKASSDYICFEIAELLCNGEVGKYSKFKQLHKKYGFRGAKLDTYTPKIHAPKLDELNVVNKALELIAMTNPFFDFSKGFEQQGLKEDMPEIMRNHHACLQEMFKNICIAYKIKDIDDFEYFGGKSISVRLQDSSVAHSVVYESRKYLTTVFTVDGKIYQVEDGVYTKKGKAYTGETIYFAMEPVDSTNKEAWERYINRIGYFVTSCSNTSILRALIPYCKEGFFVYIDKYKDAKKITGFSDEELLAYLKLLNKGGFYDEDRQELLLSVGGGTTGFILDKDVGVNSYQQYKKLPGATNQYVVYISKKPVLGRFPFPTKKVETLKQFHKYYGDILICCRSIFNTRGPVFNNRGIFRNPKVIIDGGYRRLALPLHAFSAAVVKILNEETKYLCVSAIGGMQRIIGKLLKDSIHGYIGSQDNPIENRIPSKLKGYLPEYRGLMDITSFIKVQSLLEYSC